MGSAVSALGLIGKIKMPAQALSHLEALGESASKLIEVVGRIHNLEAIGPRSVSGNLSELPKATCIPHPDSPPLSSTR